MKHYNVVAAVITDGERVFCVRKSHTKYFYTSHKWEFPGGKIEHGETPQQALRRELSEEMDFNIVVGEELVTVNHAYPDFEITMQAFVCSAVSGNFVLKEHAEYRWASPCELQTLDWCAADKPIVNAIIELLNTTNNN